MIYSACFVLGMLVLCIFNMYAMQFKFRWKMTVRVFRLFKRLAGPEILIATNRTCCVKRVELSPHQRLLSISENMYSSCLFHPHSYKNFQPITGLAK